MTLDAICNARSRAVAPLLVALLVLVLTATNADAASRTSGIVFSRPAGAVLRLDVTMPDNARNRPMVILVHGGGWWLGARKDLASTADDLTSAGYVVASIDYRLACGTASNPRHILGRSFNSPVSLCVDGDVRMGEQRADVRAAVRYMRRRARAYGGDPRRIALVGSSAGGHLAMLAATNAPLASRVSAVVNWSGPVSSGFIEEQDAATAGSIKASYTNAIGCLSSACPEAWKAASPQASTNRTTRRFAVLNAVSQRERQVSVRSMSTYTNYVRSLGWQAEILVVRGACHSRECLNEAVISRGGGTVQSRTISFLRTHL